MLFYLNRSYQTWLEHEIVLGKEKQLQALSDYSKQMESLYQEVRGCHDYINILMFNELIEMIWQWLGKLMKRF